jgi:hypothetical protein
VFDLDNPPEEAVAVGSHSTYSKFHGLLLVHAGVHGNLVVPRHWVCEVKHALHASWDRDVEVLANQHQEEVLGHVHIFHGEPSWQAEVPLFAWLHHPDSPLPHFLQYDNAKVVPVFTVSTVVEDFLGEGGLGHRGVSKGVSRQHVCVCVGVLVVVLVSPVFIHVVSDGLADRNVPFVGFVSPHVVPQDLPDVV